MLSLAIKPGQSVPGINMNHVLQILRYESERDSASGVNGLSAGIGANHLVIQEKSFFQAF
jgi:hypothetical protein